MTEGGNGVAEPEDHVMECVGRALEEDAALSDVTTATLADASLLGRAVIRVRCEGVLSGHRAARAVFAMLDKTLLYEEKISDGERALCGDIAARIEGKAASILAGERTALNFLGHLSGIATLTARFVGRIAATGTRVLDTRKTTPGLRFLEKEAVRHGGGMNHRRNLGERILVKENHITAVGGLPVVIERLAPELMREAEIEVSCLAELRLLREKPPGRIMFDNFTPEMVASAVEEVGMWGAPRPEIEVSGGIALETIGSFAMPGVDYISIGSLTSSAPALDLSLILGEAWTP